jgi:hypothetical protein
MVGAADQPHLHHRVLPGGPGHLLLLPLPYTIKGSHYTLLTIKMICFFNLTLFEKVNRFAFLNKLK